jgi:hypothetical protein
VKVLGTIALVLVLLFGILHLTGHSLGGHMPTRTPTREHGAQQP